MALGQGFAQARVRAQVKRRLALLVADGQVGTVGCQEAGDGGGALLLRSLGPQSHNQLHKTCKRVRKAAFRITLIQISRQNEAVMCVEF